MLDIPSITKIMSYVTTIVVNHGIPLEDIHAMFGASVNFFALPDQIKEKYPMDVARNAGWQQVCLVLPPFFFFCCIENTHVTDYNGKRFDQQPSQHNSVITALMIYGQPTKIVLVFAL